MLTMKGKRSRRSTVPRNTLINWENFSFPQKLDVQNQKALKLSKDDSNMPPLAMEFRVISSDSEDKNIDKRSTANWDSYSIKAINRRIDNPSDVELVETGPVAIGNLLKGGHILHLNFKVKKKGVSDVLTYFSEFTETPKNGVRVESVVCMGPSDLLPEKAHTRGCLYCHSHNIHHPEIEDSFLNGGEHYYMNLCSKIQGVHDFLEKSMRRKRKKDVDLSLKFSDPGLEFVGETCDDSRGRYAPVALCLFNKNQGSNYELVKIGHFHEFVSSSGFIMHMNFEAKEDSDVEKKTFFAQVIHCGLFFIVDFCKCLGPSNQLPDEADFQGCCYCKANIHHPLGPGYLIGRELSSKRFHRDDLWNFEVIYGKSSEQLVGEHQAHPQGVEVVMGRKLQVPLGANGFQRNSNLRLR